VWFVVWRLEVRIGDREREGEAARGGGIYR
jgi:hypothetical protein